MPITKRVELQKDETCTKCGELMKQGNIAVKDRRNRKQINKTEYYHVTCK